MKRLFLFLFLLPIFFAAQSQVVTAYPGVKTNMIIGDSLEISTIAGSDTTIIGSLPPKTSHAWSSDVILKDAVGDTEVELLVRKQDLVGNYYYEPYYSSPKDTLNTADPTFIFEDRMSAQIEVALKITPGTSGVLYWFLTPKN